MLSQTLDDFLMDSGWIIMNWNKIVCLLVSLFIVVSTALAVLQDSQ